MDMNTPPLNPALVAESKVLDPWAGQNKYGLAMNYFMLVVLGLTMLYAYLPTPGSSRGVALLRRTTYPVLGKNIPSLGFGVIVAAAFIVTLVWTFVVHPYYRPLRAYGSPPLALRAGFFATALVPWIYALASKGNIITYLTQISHEKLNVLHRWTARLCLVLSVVHTLPFFIQAMHEGNVHSTFYTGIVNISGVLALAALAWLTLASFLPLRNRFYQFFVVSHIIAAISFLAFMFWHCANTNNSWNYLYPAVAVWVAGMILRLAQSSLLSGKEQATVSVGAENVIRVSIQTEQTWTPGQHMFLRIPGVGRLSIFENHPFSIASIPEADSTLLNRMEFCVKSREGFTSRLLRAAQAKDGSVFSCHVEGPYGGVPRKVQEFDHVILVAGGSGITATLPHLLDAVRRQGNIKSIRFIWAFRTHAAVTWFNGELLSALAAAKETGLQCEFLFYQTKEALEEVTREDKSAVEGFDIQAYRPDLPQLLKSWMLDMHGRTCVIVSGPGGLERDVANASARLNALVGRRIKEVYLHTETFGW